MSRMRRTNPFHHPDPEVYRCRLQLAAPPDVDDVLGGWLFSGIAQVYGVVNDQLMIFDQGSAAKTIAERVPKGRVKLHDGHPFMAGARDVVGQVLSAEEGASGLTYQAFLSAAHEELAIKLGEGIVDENSIELAVIKEMPRLVDIDEVPELARRWVQLAPNGQAQVRSIQEWAWLALGLVSMSSQGIDAITSPPAFVPYQDLPLASGVEWDAAAAAARVEEWSSAGDLSGRGFRYAKQSRAFLARGPVENDVPTFLLQIADVVEGQLSVVPGALEAALVKLEAAMVEADDASDRALLLAAARHIGRYEERLTNSAAAGNTAALTSAETPEDGGPETPPTAADEPATDTSAAPAGPETPPTQSSEATVDDADLEPLGSQEERETYARELRRDVNGLGLSMKEPPTHDTNRDSAFAP